MSLLDYLAVEMDCQYMSDLNRTCIDAKNLQKALNVAKTQPFQNQDWIDACKYITQRNAHDQDSAQQILTDFCKQNAKTL